MEHLHNLSVKDLLSTAQEMGLVLTRDARKHKDTIITFLVNNGGDTFTDKANTLLKRKESGHTEDDNEVNERRKKQKTSMSDSTGQDKEVKIQFPRKSEAWENSHDIAQFLELPSNSEAHRCYQEFYNHTGNAAVRSLICGVCAREVMAKDTVRWSLQDMSVKQRVRLKPFVPHEGQYVVEGMLLEEKGLKVEDGEKKLILCMKCCAELAGDGQNPPALSLANNLWIGDIPWQVLSLTLPEQLLLSLNYPRVYAVKLYPTTFTGDVEGLQSGLSGTVVTFEQNMKDVAKMMEGQLLPRKPDILPSLITISFIGRGKLPRRWLQNTFRVRRNIVFDALGWYRGHNGYFRKVSISETNLALLPEDNIPRELEALIRQTSDPEVAAMEEGGYVPLPEQNGKDVEIVSSGDCEPSAAGSSEADVIPLHYTGFHDTDMNTTTASELQQWGMARLWGDGKEGGYAVRHSTKPASDFPSPSSDMNFSELTFPSLFPYGMGGFEKTRPIEISLKDHIRWALEYHDRRFRLHPHFPFTIFSIVQKREAMSSAKIQMSGPDAERQMRIISSVTPKDLKQSAEEEDAKKPISNAAVRTLRKHVFGAAARVEGSDAARMAHRSKIWSTTMMEGPPTVWITINPADIHNPIAQVFAGVDIDLDNFVKETGPDSTARARNVAQDPFAAAKFHHFIINTVLETLFGIKVNRFLIQRKTGVFGELNAYLGVDEVQNRGTLHTHMLLWFRHAPSVDETTSLLKSDDFRQKMVEFIKRNVRAYMPGFEDKTSVEKIEKDPNAGYSRPPNPSLPSYEDRLQAHELTIVRAEQVHKCQKGRCLVVKKNGLWGCKRNAPFEKSEDDVVEESGKWRCKRSYEFMNSWNPSVTVNVGCNNDIKPLLNGREVVNISFYNSTYMSKAQKHQFNISAVLAKGMESHLRRAVEDEARKELERGQKTLLFRMLNSMNREQELSAPLVMSYLMGWGDVHSSHMYTVLRWNTFSSQLRRTFPALKWQKMITKEVTESSTNRNEFTQEEVPNETLTVADNGTVFAKSQFTDYVLRGTNLNHICLLDFIVDTYDEAQKESKRADSGAESSGENQRGRPRNLRSKYDSRHPNALTRERVIR